ncbi:MAG: MATE family efflux transporter [Clostridiales bacterium]|nr:MATE family efflux transporter [Clostridiales bacterium]
MKLRSFIGSKAFYRTVLAIAVPVMIQNGITQFVSLLDNLMVGQLGTEQMSGVAIANQLIFIYNLCVFGGLAGAGIFGAQFSGKRDVDGVRSVFRFKLCICIAVFAVGLTVLGLFHKPLIGLFLHEGSAEGDLQLTLEYGAKYLKIMLIGLLPHAISQAYASTLRESGETVKPMMASVTAVFTNLVFNYILIFGKLGLPAMGAAGAAAATVISRFVEFALIAYWAHAHPERTPYFIDAYKTLRIPKELTGAIMRKGMPLLLNEMFWSMGISMLNQCYSVRGLSTIAAANIASTVSMLFNTIFMALGSSIGILVGNQLGAGKKEEAVDTNNKMTAFSVASCFVLGVLLFAVSGVIPGLYNTSAEVRGYATSFLRTIAVCMPIHAFSHACYFTLRTGGLTRITMLFDSGYVWLVCVPTAFILSRFTTVPVPLLYFICNAVEIIKCFVGYFFVKSRKWVNTIVPS